MLYWLAITALPLLCLLMAAAVLNADAWPHSYRWLGPWLACLASVPFCYIAGVGIVGGRSWRNVLTDALCAAAIMLVVGAALTAAGFGIGAFCALLGISVGVLGVGGTIGFLLVTLPAPVVVGAIYGLALHGVHIAVHNEPTLPHSSGRKIHAICGAIAGPIAFYSIWFISATGSHGLVNLLPQDQWARNVAALLISWAGALPHLYQTGRQLRSDIARGFAPAVGHGSFAFRLFGGVFAALAVLATAAFAY
jgi:hypothetical protein